MNDEHDNAITDKEALDRTWMGKADLTPYSWLFREDVRVTLIGDNPDEVRNTVLVERTPDIKSAGWPQPVAAVIDYAETQVFLNGKIVVEDDATVTKLCSIADAVLMAPTYEIGDSGITNVMEDDDEDA